MQKTFNLVTEPWIPVVDVGRVSLQQVFSHPEYRMLGGNPVEKIALLKLLQAIAQAAATPADTAHWQTQNCQGTAQCCLDYLQQWQSAFDLYGKQPFLQMPAIAAATVQSFGAVSPQIATGNTTVFTQTQVERPLSDADQALQLITLMGFALGGKKTDNRVVLSAGYPRKSNDKGKPATGKPGPAVAHMGLLHNYTIGQSLQQTIWMNLLTHEDIVNMQMFPHGVGVAPWQQMPQGENCATAQALKSSLIGRLVPLCRFCLLTENGLHYSEGILHDNYKEGMFDPTIAVNTANKEPKALWTNPEQRPWRQLPALLSFIKEHASTPSGFHCLQLRLTLPRVIDKPFAIWSGGLRVSSNAGEQYVSGTDDFVESIAWFSPDQLSKDYFLLLEQSMAELEQLAKQLFACVSGYFKTMNFEDKGARAGLACNQFWQLCEQQLQELIEACNEQEEAARKQLHHRFEQLVSTIYNQTCGQETARQLDAWAKHRPKFKRETKATKKATKKAKTVR